MILYMHVSFVALVKREEEKEFFIKSSTEHDLNF